MGRAGELGGGDHESDADVARGASAVVTIAPFGLTVRNSAGQVVLTTAAATGGPSLGLTWTQQPLGSSDLPQLSRYAPITFEVGGATALQFPASQYEGNLLAGVHLGVDYASTNVESIASAGNGWSMVVGTDDPSGRTIRVDLTRDRVSGAVDFSAALSSATGVVSLSTSFRSGADEAFHGLGGRHDGVDQHGQQLTRWTQEEDQSPGPLSGLVGLLPGTGGQYYLFPNGPTAAYYVQNSFISSRGYGFALLDPHLSLFRLDSDRPDAWQVNVAAPAIRAVISPGSPTAAITALTSITGRQSTPPTWAEGTLLYRGVKSLIAPDTGTTYLAKVRDDLAQIDANHLHVSGYDIEGWSLLSPADLASVIAALKARGIHPMAYLRSYVSNDGAGTEPAANFDYARAHGLLATDAAGAPYLFGSPFIVGAAGVLDFTNPAAVAWYQSRVVGLLDMGFDGFMTDFGEQVLTGMHFYNGETGETMHNEYSIDYQRATRAVVTSYEVAHSGRSIFYFNRAGFTGTPGSAAYESANFPGDETTDCTPGSGLPSVVPDMLNRAVGGAPGYSTEIGGYLDELTGTPSAELFTRWAEASALMPYFRVHNSSTTGVRMPWSYDPATLATYKQMADLHAAAVPYLD
ncbi:MAG: hypothetical protein M3O28_03905, partial [Actinomycetota bacterium]|nr:hypothetical protein [Actinomycetota bacterium]